MDAIADRSSFRCTLRVRYHETDQQGIVYHARYFEYLDVAMTEYFRHIGWPYTELVTGGCDPSLVKTTVEFLGSARFDECICISVTPARVGSNSYTLAFRVVREMNQQLLLSAETVYVNLDPTTQKSRPLPPDFRAKLQADLAEDITGDSSQRAL